jgi:hypothetical protein
MDIMEDKAFKTTPNNLFSIYMEERKDGETYTEWLDRAANCKCSEMTHHD